MALASQYMHVLRQPRAASIPAPVYDQLLTAPVLVLDTDGRAVYPAPQPGALPAPSTLADPKTGLIPDRAKTGLYRFLIPAADGPIRVISYPVIYQGELLGYVVAQPGKMTSTLPLIALIILCAAVIALLLLYVLMRPVTSTIRGNIEILTAKVTAMSHGIIDSLPRGNRIPELDILAEEMEAVARTRATPQARTNDPQAGSDRAYGAYFPMLIDTARLPYCFISSDFHLLTSNRALAALQELALARRGVSIFESGMTNMQSKQLVRALNDARTTGEGEASLSFMVAGESRDYTISVRKFAGAQGGSQSGEHVFGLLFKPQNG
jgi:hypothetical protein